MILLMKKSLSDFARLKVSHRKEEDTHRVLYPFDDIVKTALKGFVKRNFAFEYVDDVLSRLLPRVFDFLVDNEKDWVAEKTVEFLAVLEYEESNIESNERTEDSEADLWRFIDDVIFISAQNLLDQYKKSDMDFLSERFLMLHMRARNILPEISVELFEKGVLKE